MCQHVLLFRWHSKATGTQELYVMPIKIITPKNLERCLLREIDTNDAVAVASIEYDRELKRFFEFPSTPEQDFIQNFDPQLARGYAIEELDRRNLVGTIDFYNHADSNHQKEIRIFIKKDYCGQGIGFSALSYMIGCLFNTHWVHELVAVIDYRNSDCIGLFEKARFSNTGKTDDNKKLIFVLSKETYNHLSKREA